ncbi:MAG: hypothetical protein DWQ01_22520 [Planctomycetota bacterium]|nr:MAG: hypothetical protein DWQ01_22520 [Planctomycetota bacterium]
MNQEKFYESTSTLFNRLDRAMGKYVGSDAGVGESFGPPLGQPFWKASGYEKRKRLPGGIFLRGTRIGRFELRELLGVGAQGEVYLALDSQSGKAVALKVLRARNWGAPLRKLERFQREAAAIAKLKHPGLCSLISANFEADPPHIAMSYVPGRSLRQVLSEADPSENPDSVLPLPPRSFEEIQVVLRFFEKVATAIGEAHRLKVVHRDIKPGNIVAGEHGDPVVLDFGLATVEGFEEHLTITGDVFGTPAYMSPEHYLDAKSISEKSDQFSLGLVLYECLTLQPAFGRGNSGEIRERILFGRPKNPKTHNPKVSSDLAYVVLKAIARDPSHRYENLDGLRTDLMRVRRGLSVRKETSLVYSDFVRWIFSFPKISISASALVVGLLITTIVTWLLFHASREEARVLRAYRMADICEEVAANSPRTALHLVKRAKREAGEDGDQSIFASAALAVLPLYHQNRRFLDTHQTLASICASKEAPLIFACVRETGDLLRVRTDRWSTEKIAAELLQLEALAASPSGTSLVSVDQRKGWLLWDFSGSEAKKKSLSLEGPHLATEFSPSGRWLAASSEEGEVLLFDLESGLPTSIHASGSSKVVSAKFNGSEDSLFLFEGIEYLKAGDPIGRIRKLNTKDGLEQASTLECSAISSADLASFEGVEFLVVGTREGELFRVHSDLHRISWKQEFGRWIHDIEIAPDGNWIGVGFAPEESGNQPCFLFLDAIDGSTVWSPPNASKRSIVGLSFSPSGKELATVGYSGFLKIWDTQKREQLLAAKLPIYRFAQQGVQWLPGGTSLLANTDRGVAFLLETVSHVAHPYLRGHEDAVVGFQFGDDPSTLLSHSRDGTARLWSWRNGTTLETYGDGKFPILAAGITHSGSKLLLADEGGRLQIFSVVGGRLLRSMDFTTDKIEAIQVDEPGHRAFLLCESGVVKILDCIAGEIQGELYLENALVESIELSRDGEYVLGNCAKDGVAVWRIGSSGPLAEVKSLPHWRIQVPIISCSWLDPQGREIICVTPETKAFVVERDGSERKKLDVGFWGGELAVHSAHDSAMIGSAYSNRVSLIRGLKPGKQTVTKHFPGHVARIISVAANPSSQGPLFATADEEGWIMLYGSANHQPVRFRAHADLIHKMEFSPDGNWLAVAFQDGSVRFWPSMPLELLATMNLGPEPNFARLVPWLED